MFPPSETVAAAPFVKVVLEEKGSSNEWVGQLGGGCYFFFCPVVERDCRWWVGGTSSSTPASRPAHLVKATRGVFLAVGTLTCTQGRGGEKKGVRGKKGGKGPS